MSKGCFIKGVKGGATKIQNSTAWVLRDGHMEMMMDMAMEMEMDMMVEMEIEIDNNDDF